MRTITIWTICILPLLLCGTALAHDTVTDTEIVSHHGDRVPRFANVIPGNHLVVAAGETFTLPPDSTLDAIEVAGTLKFSHEHDTILRFTHLQMLPGGRLECGTESEPMLRSVQLVIRDVPLATGTVEQPGPDPFQWGNGIVNFGQWVMHDRTLTPWATFPGADAGATGIPVPADWRDRDSLLLPDVRQITATTPARRERPVNLLGGVLSKPLDFEHQPVVKPDGETVHLPVVANATRNIVVRSENPHGVRGHTVTLGGGFSDVRYAAFLGLGRTLPINLDNTTVDSTGKVTKIGTNQIARYAWHWHHVHNSPGTLIGCYFDGSDIGKWGVVVHSSHGMRIEHNVADQFVGAGFITEDGPETRNLLDNNLSMYCRGNGISGKFNLVPPRNIPGGEGAGFWFRGPQNTVTNNVAVCNAVGFQWFYRNQVVGHLVDDVPFDPRTALPISASGNVAISNGSGVEYWNQPRFPVIDQISAHNRIQIQPGSGEAGHVYLVNPTLVAVGGVAPGITSSAAYTSSCEVDGGYIGGCSFGVKEARAFLRLRNLTMQNRRNVDFFHFRPGETLLESVMHKPLGDFPKDYVFLGRGFDWKPGDEVPRRYTSGWIPADGQRYVVKNWQGTGKDYLLFETQSHRDKPAWPNIKTWADHEQLHAGNCPEHGLTFGQCWDKYGIAYGGGVYSAAEAVSLEGLVNGIGRLGLEYPLGPPRAVLIDPSPLTPAKVLSNGKITVRLVQTGIDQFSTNPVAFEVDGGEPIYLKPRQGLTSNHRLNDLAIPTTEGTHAVKTWRVDASGQKIAGSELAFTYFIGEPTPLPDPDPEPDPRDEQIRRARELAEEILRVLGE